MLPFFSVALRLILKNVPRLPFFLCSASPLQISGNLRAVASLACVWLSVLQAEEHLLQILEASSRIEDAARNR